MRKIIFLIALFGLGSFNMKAGSFSHTVAPSPCLACDIANGLAASVNGTAATLTWNAVAGASKYNVEVEDEQNTPSTFHVEATVTGSSYTVTGLQAGVKYKFKVRTQCSGDKSNWSEWVFFNGNSGGGGSGVCAVPVVVSASVSGTSATLLWKTVSGATQYYVEVEDEQNAPPSNFHVEVTVQDSFYTVTGLKAGVLYKFKVRTHCGNGQSDWSDWVFFNGNSGNGSSGGGGCTKPSGAAVTDITATSALLSWTAVPGIASYTIEIERNQSGSTAWKITQVVTTSSFLLTGLTPNVKYKFKVRSNCPGGGHSDWAKWRLFKTLQNVAAPTENRSSESTVSTAPAAVAQLQAWPNPAQTEANIRLKNLASESAALRLFDLTGRMVQEQQVQLQSGAWEGVLPVSDLHPGVYLLQVRAGQHLQTFKLVVNHP